MQRQHTQIGRYTLLITLVSAVMIAAYVVFLDEDEDTQTIGFANEQMSITDELINRGQEIYTTSCASCHGANGEGQVPEAPMQPDETGRIPAPPHDETGHTWHHDDDLLFDYVKNGGRGDPELFYPMPGFGDSLSDEEAGQSL